MLKKFVPLDSDVGPSQTPFNTKTFKAYEDIPVPLFKDPCSYQPLPHLCTPGKLPLPKSLTMDEATFHWFDKPKMLKFQQPSRNRKCKKFEPYTKCVVNRRTSGVLKEHAVVREKYLKSKAEMRKRIHNAKEPLSDGKSLIQMSSPVFGEEGVRPEVASPNCSLEIFHVPSRKLLDLKRPRSGIFINETPRPTGIDIPYKSYNPRQLQQELETEQRTKYTLLSDGDRFYFPWLKGQGDIEEPRNTEVDVTQQGLTSFKPRVFPIPDDLEKTFRANVVFGNEVIALHNGNIRPYRSTEVACLYAAYVESFSKNPDYWSAKTIDSVLQSGAELFKKSNETNYHQENDNLNIIPELAEKEASVDVKLLLIGQLLDEPNILKSLTLFFNKFQAGILCAENLIILIWKRCADFFYIFDPNGRDVECKRDFQGGKSSLMAVQTVEHIVHLVMNYSEISSETEFSLYEISLKDFGKISNPLNIRIPMPNKKRYAIVNRFYAIIPAISGLHTGSTNDNASLMICYLTLVYSQIDSPRFWTVKVVDDLIQFGKKYHSDFACDNRLQNLNIAHLPEVLLFGNYRVLIDKKAFVVSGHCVDCWSYRTSQLTQAIKELFSTYNLGLLQVDSSAFGLWKEGSTFFVFDPFKRGPAGQAGSFSKNGTGCLQIHLNMESLLRMVYTNSIVVKTEGNFFLHGIRVKAIGTFNINPPLEDTAGFGTLQIKYPFSLAEEPETQPDFGNNSVAIGSLNYNLVQCLSELSITPCERTCSEREFITQQKKISNRKKLVRSISIKSIPEEYRIPEFDDVDVIDSIVGQLVGDVMKSIERKTEKRPKTCIEASKILLRSDRKHLEDLKLRLKRGEDFDNICTEFQLKASPATRMSVRDELAIETNFKVLPDGSWAVFGTSNVDTASDPLKGILASITAAALSSKYNISTWSSDVIEYALESSVALEELFWSFNHTLDLIFRKQIPKIQVGQEIFDVKVISSETVEPNKLKSAVESALLRVEKLFLLCRGLSCFIVKRYNMTYMFMGCPCNVVGFRSKSPGPICLLRFLETSQLVRRIENACGVSQKCVLVELKVKNVTQSKPQKFAIRTVSKENLVYDKELADKESRKQRNKEKISFIESELRKELKRVERFQVDKRRRKLSIDLTQQSLLSDDSYFNNDNNAEEGELYEESVESVHFKHKPHENIQTTNNKAEDQTRPLSQLGYQLRDLDCLFKIQGSTALKNRFESSNDKIKSCFFASTVALLYAILRPLNHWDHYRVDKVIHVANTIANSTTNFNSSFERIIRNIEADEFVFEVKVAGFTPSGTFGGSLEYKINKAIQTRKYFLIQISNGTFTVYYDRYFHLFDPYPSMELVSKSDSDETKSQTCPDDDIIRQPEQNTASWVLFGDLASLLNYIDKRSANQDWQTDYKLHSVSIISHRIAPKRKRLLNWLTDDFDSCQKSIQSDNLCTHPEQIEWLDIYPNLVRWSRLNKKHSDQQFQSSSFTKNREFDIEIPEKLHSLWGSIHPLSRVFGDSRGKQHLAINVVACCVASVYRVDDWNGQILDSIVITGHDFHNDSVSSINRADYEISLEHLNTSFQMNNLNFAIHLESVTHGYLYTKKRFELNLAAALEYFFKANTYGIIQCMKRSLAFGKYESGYFMFECQSHGLPLFPPGEGAAYVLLASQLQTLLYCIVMTFNNLYHNSHFTIHKVEVTSGDTEEQAEEEGEVEGEDQ